MPNWNLFQIVVLAGFGVLLIGGVALFAMFGGTSGEEVGSVTIWGTVERSSIEKVLVEMAGTDDSFQNVSYIEKSPATYRQELTEAIARGAAPDLAMIDDSDIVSFLGKIEPIPYSFMNQRTFADTYIDEASLFSGSQGIIGMPFLMDPLVMYWNRDLFAGAGVANYPKTWTELQAVAPRMTSLDGTAGVRRSAVALGTYDNVRHAKEIVSALLLQAGDPIVRRADDGTLVNVFGLNNTGSPENPAEAVLRFYTNFANPSQASYSWNRALPDSFAAFTAGDLGVYFGFASEYRDIVSRNPNLSVGVATLPQTSVSRTPLTFGRLIALAVPRGAMNPAGGAIIAERLSSEAAIAIVTAQTGLPPVRRDVLSADSSADSVGSVFAQSALIARSWYDPSPSQTSAIFRDMIESVISGRERLGDAVRSAQISMTDIFDRLQLQ